MLFEHVPPIVIEKEKIKSNSVSLETPTENEYLIHSGF